MGEEKNEELDEMIKEIRAILDGLGMPKGLIAIDLGQFK